MKRDVIMQIIRELFFGIIVLVSLMLISGIFDYFHNV